MPTPVRICCWPRLRSTALSSVHRINTVSNRQQQSATVGTRCAVFSSVFVRVFARVFARVFRVQSVRVHEPEKVYEPVNEQSAVTVPV